MSATETVIQQPDTYQPCFSPIWFTASSTESGNAGFSYKVKCTDSITAETLTYQIDKRPSDSLLTFDASNFAKNYIKHYIPNKAYGWQVCTDAYRAITVNVDFRTTASPTPTYASGYNIDFKVWNGAETYLNFPDYDYNDYIYEDFTLAPFTWNHPQLNEITEMKTYADKSLYLYLLGGSTNITGIGVTTYDAAGNALTNTSIANPYWATSDYTERFNCIDIGYKGLSNIASTLVTGDYPIISANTASYVIYDLSGNDATVYRTVTVGCEPTYTPFVLHYLNRLGGFDTINLTKLSEQTLNSSKTYYRQNPYEMVANEWVYDKFTSNEVALSSTKVKRVKLNSDWLTDEQVTAYEALYSGARAYLDMGSTTGLLPVKILNTNYLINQNFNNKLYQLTLDIEYTYVDNLQNG